MTASADFVDNVHALTNEVKVLRESVDDGRNLATVQVIPSNAMMPIQQDELTDQPRGSINHLKPPIPHLENCSRTFSWSFRNRV